MNILNHNSKLLSLLVVLIPLILLHLRLYVLVVEPVEQLQIPGPVRLYAVNAVKLFWKRSKKSVLNGGIFHHHHHHHCHLQTIETESANLTR